MGGRGTYAAGKNVAPTYREVSRIHGIKVLQGNDSQHHSLPVESKTSSAYIKLRDDGTFLEMNIFDDNHHAKFQIGYHSEKNLAKQLSVDANEPILHMHYFNREGRKFRDVANPITDKLVKEYSKVWKGREPKWKKSNAHS